MKCASCGQEQPSGAAFCQYCGAVNASQTIHQGSPPPPAAGAPTVCVCGRKLASGEFYCPSCGRPAKTGGGTQLGSPFGSAYGSPAPGQSVYGPFNVYGTGGATPNPQPGYGQSQYPQGQYGQSYLPVPMPPQQMYPFPRKNKVTAGLLALFVGGLGIHKFYLNQPALGVLYLLFFWTGIPLFVSFIEGIVYLCQSDQSFDYQYNNYPYYR